MKCIKVKRRKQQISIINSYSMGWRETATFITLNIFGIKIKTLYAYFISYRGHYCDLTADWRYYEI